MTIKAVVFDMDGVLIDSEQIWDEVREQLTKETGGTWRDDAQQTMMGMSSLEWTVYMAESLEVSMTPQKISEVVVERLIKRYAEAVPLLAGAVEVVREVSASYPLAIASSSNREIIDAVLDVTGLTECFAATVSSEEVSGGKPAPDVYLEAASRLSVEPTHCAAVEDSSNGLRSAAAAGMKVVAIPNRHYPPATDALELASCELRTLTELPRVLSTL